MSEESGKRRRKAQYVGSAKRHRGSKQLDVGMQGILITCNMNERKCVGEAYSLLNEYGDQLYGPEKLSEKDDGTSESEEDAEEALKKEVNEIRSSIEKNLRRFQSIESGANNVVFIRTLKIDPEKLVHHILKDIYTTKKKKTRVILRMLPVSGTCKAFPEDLKKYAETFFEPWFKTPNKGTFQIVYKARNNNHMNRDEVIKDLAGIVGNQNPENKVDLSNPEYTIVVEIIKNVCCLSVVKDYMLFRKYNLQEVVKSSGAEQPQKDPTKDEKPPEAKNDNVPPEAKNDNVPPEAKNDNVPPEAKNDNVPPEGKNDNVPQDASKDDEAQDDSKEIKDKKQEDAKEAPDVASA